MYIGKKVSRGESISYLMAKLAVKKGKNYLNEIKIKDHLLRYMYNIPIENIFKKQAFYSK